MESVGLVAFGASAAPVPVLALETLEHLAGAMPSLAQFAGVMGPLKALLDGREVPSSLNTTHSIPY